MDNRFAELPELIIVNSRVLDGRGGPNATPRTVVVHNGLIAALLNSNEKHPRAQSTIDAEGMFLLPGFIDAHAHILVPRCQSFASGRLEFDRALSELVASALLDFGVTTVRSPATPTIDGLAMRDDLNAGRVRGPSQDAVARRRIATVTSTEVDGARA